MKTTHVTAIVLGIVCGIVLFIVVPRIGKTAPSKNPVKQIVQNNPSPTSLPEATPIPKETGIIPVKLKITKANIDAAVEEVANDAHGRMDVPKDPLGAGWYKPGYKPGQVGSAVIAAHFDTKTGAPGPFYEIKNLESGDRIDVEDANGKTLTFTVEEKKMHKDANFPIQEVFAKADKPRLNLITCAGTWDPVAHNYSDRLVVYAVLE